MRVKFDIHNLEQRYSLQLKKIEELEISNDLKEKMLQFLNDLEAKGYTYARLETYAKLLRKIVELFNFKSLNDIKNLNEEDVKKVVAKIEKLSYSYWTKRDLKILVKKFIPFCFPEKQNIVSWIKTTGLTAQRKKVEKTLPKEILTVEEINKLAEAAENIRDKALVLTLYETGARIGEFLNMRIGDIKFDEYGAKIVLEGKTGMRWVRVLNCVSALANWLSQHPFKDDKDAFVWVGFTRRNENKPISYREVVKILKELSKKAKINKDVHPHLFRHSRATELAKILTEQQLKVYFGWEQSSKMASIYVHLSGKDVDNTILKFYGINVEEKELELKPKKCARCGTINDSSSKFCSNCGMPLDLKVAIEIEENRKVLDEFLEYLLKDKEFAMLMVKKTKELLNRKDVPKELKEKLEKLLS